MSDLVLEISALTRRFGAITAVDALTLSVNAGSTSTFRPRLDDAVILLTTTILVFIGARLYPRLAT